MSACVPTLIDPKQLWQEQAFAALEKSFGRPLQWWLRLEDTTWEPAGQEEGADESLQKGWVDLENYSPFLDAAHKQDQPLTMEVSPGVHLLAIPLGAAIGSRFAVATSEFETNSPELLLHTAKISQHYFQQQKKLVQIQDENEFFLKQVRDDFEELSFLRSMALQLGLGTEAQEVSQLIVQSLPTLGEAVCAKSLYFVSLSNEGEVQIAAEWNAFHDNQEVVDGIVLKKLVEHFRQKALKQPVIKNDFQTHRDGFLFPGVEDFILTSISTGMNEVGWFLAVNRFSSEDRDSNPMTWRLSQHEFGANEASLLSTAAAMLASHANNVVLFQERETLLVDVVKVLISAVEAKDRYTFGHSERVALYAKRLARQIGYDEKQCELLYLTGLLHDIGKIAVSDAILGKPDQLTDEEFTEIMCHPDEGWAILRELKQFSYVLPGVLHHHERTDGTGYPDGLAGDAIPQDGRVLAVADAYDAMTSDRAYRQGMSHEKAIELLQAGAGSQWDPEMVDAFLEIIDEIIEIRDSYQPRPRPERKPSLSAAV